MTDTATCPYCAHTQPEHDQHCPVQELTNGLTRAATTGEDLEITFYLPDDDSMLDMLIEVWNASNEQLAADTEE